MNPTDFAYRNLVETILTHGDDVSTRGHDTLSIVHAPNYVFNRFPLVTLRKTAAMKAIREMEWFMSGDPGCPKDLMDWWDGQLNPGGYYRLGYPTQFRSADGYFDQVHFVLNALRNNPASRRIVLTAWNPGDMAEITERNGNPRTPTTCHSTVVQFFVRAGKVHMTSYQRSCDVLLGLPHNWAQSWAMLMYFAHHSGHQVGSMRWVLGDAHIYKEPTHLQVAEIIASTERLPSDTPTLVYDPEPSDEPVPPFKTTDFTAVGNIPEPVTKIRPILMN